MSLIAHCSTSSVRGGSVFKSCLGLVSVRAINCGNLHGSGSLQERAGIVDDIMAGSLAIWQSGAFLETSLPDRSYHIILSLPCGEQKRHNPLGDSSSRGPAIAGNSACEFATGNDSDRCHCVFHSSRRSGPV
jgi:hypothetical protein